VEFYFHSPISQYALKRSVFFLSRRQGSPSITKLHRSIDADLEAAIKTKKFRPMTLTADIQEQFGTIWNGKGSTGRFLCCILVLLQENSLYEKVHR